MASYTTEERGSRNSVEYRLFFKVNQHIVVIIIIIFFFIDHDHDDPQDGEGNPISAMHDIPMLSGDGVYNMVVEVIVTMMVMTTTMVTVMMMLILN